MNPPKCPRCGYVGWWESQDGGCSASCQKCQASSIDIAKEEYAKLFQEAFLEVTKNKESVTLPYERLYELVRTAYAEGASRQTGGVPFRQILNHWAVSDALMTVLTLSPSTSP
jgi:hypothetical protein